jgi:hypothetical protein
MNQTTVRVDLSVRGVWEVALSDRSDRVTCNTLEEAGRLAQSCAEKRRPCELIVRDAYHRVVHHQVVSVSGDVPERLPLFAGMRASCWNGASASTIASQRAVC